jgi:hypothetical protein
MMAARLSEEERACLSEADRAANHSLYTQLKETALAHLAALKERALLKESAAASAIVSDDPAAVTPRPVLPVAPDMMDTNFANSIFAHSNASRHAASAPISLAADSPPDSPNSTTTTSAADRSLRAPTNSAKTQFSSYSAAVTDSALPPASHSPPAQPEPHYNHFMTTLRANQRANNVKRRASETSQSSSASYLAEMMDY